MNYCSNCGNKLDNNIDVCLKCGIKLKNEYNNVTHDNGGIGWSLLGFFVPLAGLILYFIWRKEKPKTAKSLGKGALLYLALYIMLLITIFVFGFIFAVNSETSTKYNNSYNESYYKFE